MNNPQISAAAKNAALDAITALLNAGGAGTLKIYDGDQPAGPGTAVSTQVMLVSCALSATSFAAAADGVATANAIAAGDPAANGTASWARISSGAGTAVIDCTVGTSSADITVGSTTISTGVPVAPSSLTLTHP